MRRVVASPVPQRIFELRPIRWLLEHGTVVICAGGGGIPTTWAAGQRATLTGIEAVIDKDLRQRAAGPRPRRRPLRHGDRRRRRLRRRGARPSSARSTRSRPTSCAPCRSPRGRWGRRWRPRPQFVERTGRRAAIGALDEIEEIVEGRAGTNVVPARTLDERRGDPMSQLGVHSEVGNAAQGHGPPTRSEPEAADAHQPRRVAVRRRAVGRAGAEGARPVRRRACASAASRCSCSRTCWPRRWQRATRRECG